MTVPITEPIIVDPVVPPLPVVEAPPAEAKPEIDWKAEARKHEARAKENAGAAARLAVLEDAAKTDAQRLTDRAEAAERRAAALESSALRSSIAAEHGIPADLVDRLRGDTAEALTEDAKALTALLKITRPVADVDQGARGTGAAGPAQITQAELSRMSPAAIVKAQADGLLDTLLGIKR